jgi:hypothetical protein
MAGPLVTLFAVICVNIADPTTCHREAVTDSDMAPQMTMNGCLGSVESQVSVAKWLEEHPEAKDHLKGWACRMGGDEPQHRDYHKDQSRVGHGTKTGQCFEEGIGFGAC